MASQITNLAIFYSTVYSRRRSENNIKDPRHWPLWGKSTGNRRIPRTKGQPRAKVFPFDDVIMPCKADNPRMHNYPYMYKSIYVLVTLVSAIFTEQFWNWPHQVGSGSAPVLDTMAGKIPIAGSNKTNCVNHAKRKNKSNLPCRRKIDWPYHTVWNWYSKNTLLSIHQYTYLRNCNGCLLFSPRILRMLHPRQKAANSTTLPSSVVPHVVITTTPSDSGDEEDARPTHVPLLPHICVSEPGQHLFQIMPTPIRRQVTIQINADLLSIWIPSKTLEKL